MVYQRNTARARYHALYNDGGWRKRRLHQLKVAPLCEECEAEGRVTPATVVHHLVPHRGDPSLFLTSPLQSLCAWHHDSQAQREEKRGYREGYGLDGLPLDPKHPVYEVRGEGPSEKRMKRIEFGAGGATNKFPA